MDCMKCHSAIQKDHTCPTCGVNADFFKKAYNTANYYYNSGLEKAKIRDLSGAVSDLNKALKYKKELTDARNLLGLVYFEMGETAKAVREWKISLHFQPSDNLAQTYQSYILDNPGRLDNANQVAKKYNQTLTYMKQKNDDMAFIQIKKVLTLSPNFIKGQLLLAFMHLKNDEKEKAKKILEKVLKMDTHNMTAIRYLTDINGNSNGIALNVSQEKKEEKKEEPVKRQVDKKVSAQPLGSYKEPVSNMRNLVYIFIGFAVCFLAMWFLVIPSKVSSTKEAMQKSQTSAEEELAAKNATITSLKEKNKTLTTNNKKLTKELETYRGDDAKSLYDRLLLASQYYYDNDRVSAAEELIQIKESDLKTDTAKQVYQDLCENTLEYASQSLYGQGWNQYNVGNYDEALELLKKSYEMNKENTESLYFMARCYDRKGDTKNAKKYYNLLIKDFPGTSRANDAQGYLNTLEANS